MDRCGRFAAGESQARQAPSSRRKTLSPFAGAAQILGALFLKLRILILRLAALLMAVIFALDYAVGRDFDLWLLYLVPISLASVVLGPRYGYGCALAATGLLLLGDSVVGSRYASGAALALDRASESIAYLLLVFLIGVVRTSISSTDLALACSSSPQKPSFSSQTAVK